MPILGVESAVFGVDDLQQSAAFATDFGLPLESRSASEVVFRLATGSSVVLQGAVDPGPS